MLCHHNQQNFCLLNPWWDLPLLLHKLKWFWTENYLKLQIITVSYIIILLNKLFYECSFSANSVGLVIILFPILNSNLRSCKPTVVVVVETVFAVWFNAKLAHGLKRGVKYKTYSNTKAHNLAYIINMCT
jgi:hypothetical protein